MKCPKCGGHCCVRDTRITDDRQVRRRRHCESCGYRFATMEIEDTKTPLRQWQPKKEKLAKKPRVAKPRLIPKPRREERVRTFEEFDGGMTYEEREDLSVYVDLPDFNR